MSFFVTSNSCKLFRKFHVHVVNGLSRNKILQIHCKSADNDLGAHSLAKGREFSWSFRINFILTTLYWCHMAPDDHSHVDLKVFWDSQYLFERCGGAQQCIWTAKDDGVYLRNIPKNTDEFQHKWESAKLNPY
ncbi:S-protein homolog 74 [Ricinus communis]|nr:S-protein homolog 74 [Ricinus communis]